MTSARPALRPVQDGGTPAYTCNAQVGANISLRTDVHSKTEVRHRLCMQRAGVAVKRPRTAATTPGSTVTEGATGMETPMLLNDR